MTAMTMMSMSAMAAIGVLGTGCALDDADSRAAGAEAVVTSAIEGICPPWGCRENAADLGDGRVFHDLDLSGAQRNSGGVLVHHIATTAGTPVFLYVDNQDRLQASTGNPFDAVLFLIGADGTQYRVQFLAGHQMSAWTRSGTNPRALESYDVNVWTGWAPPDPNDPPTRRRQLCKGDGLDTDPDWHNFVYSAFTFSGDQYDPVRKTVAERPSGSRWINLACGGTATAKMLLLSHTVHASNSGVASSIGMRQTWLKLITADYCGDGTPYTHNGQPLDYGDANPKQFWGILPGEPVEAIWTPTGAFCLNTPRAFNRSDVACQARLPPCTPDVVAGWRNHGYAMSALIP